MALIAPNTHFHWPIAMPRTLVPGSDLDDKTFIPLAPTFADYPPEKFRLVLGKATSLSPASNVAVVGLIGGGSRLIRYHTLIAATRSRAHGGMPFKGLSDTLETQKSSSFGPAATDSVRSQVKPTN
ncbi:unnamed protein product [Clonostachys rosea f. rosea IK726]|nr:unnamed protein product [Clonostachys rosea f. rosea IK726]CAG9950986.1 unnamed protein product [Clonostachys rosea f. rosea IK726]